MLKPTPFQTGPLAIGVAAIDLSAVPEFGIGALWVQPMHCRIAGDTVVTLEPRVMQVLVALAMAPGRVVSRAALIDQCWGGRIVGEDAITRAMVQLRKAGNILGGDHFRIETLNKIGYQLVGTVTWPDAEGSLVAAPLLASTSPPPVAGTEFSRDNGVPVLAVLAFDNLSNDPDLAYFSDGVSEEILHAVARAKGLRVIGRASAFQFRGADKNAEAVAARLGATHMLDGSVRRAGDTIRISAELIDTKSMQTLWTDRFDRQLNDIFVVQDEIAAAIAAALDGYLAAAMAQIEIDPVAYDLHLQAVALFSSGWSAGQLSQGIALLERAVSRAPDFAAAWATLAGNRAFTLPLTSDAAGNAIRPTVQIAARRALELNPQCAYAYVALFLTLPAFSNFAEKLRLAKLACSCGDGELTPRLFYAGVAASVGHIREACDIYDEVKISEPLDQTAAFLQAVYYRSSGRIDRSLALAEAAVAAYPASNWGRLCSSLVLLHSGQTDRAAEILADAPPDELPYIRAELAVMQAPDSRTPKQRLAPIRSMLELSKPVSINDAALVATAGDADLAFASLLAGIDDGQVFSAALKDGSGTTRANTAINLFSLRCEALRRDPRFAIVCVRLGLYDYWLESGHWPDCVAEVAPYYDLRAECAKHANLPRYAENA
ncbi:MAG: hypothetical protein GZ085_08555 [Sulfuriferula multivorans]|uniref:OmpR/PhoB-type domain-containing protein n=1 Tax=Sulfuriferula multivorans TaxID=1559896 RepID=A0A7C9NRG4_9PROT|nr:hypothetical protein [Sulfuriferula multivorans]